MQYIRRNKIWLFPIFLMAIIAPFTPYLDIKFANYFFEKGEGVDHFISHPVLDFFYVWALVPGQIVAVVATLALILSYIIPKVKRIRPVAMYLVLVFAIGSGFVSHAMLKDHWGRPRPKQIIEFGGAQEFRPFYKPNFFNKIEPSKSFPCGHATVGFYFFAFILLGMRLKKKWIYYFGIFSAIILGTILGFTRCAQGGHFFSDVLMAALIMWLSSVLFDWLIYEEMA